MLTKYTFRSIHFYSRLTKISNLLFSNSDAIPEVFWNKGGGEDYVRCKSLNLYNQSERTFVQGTVIHMYMKIKDKRKW